MKKAPRIALLASLALCTLLLLAVVAARLWFHHYLNSSAFRERIATAASRALKADGELLPPHLAGTTIYSDGFIAHGTSAAFFSELRAEQVRADFNWHGLLHQAWRIDQIELQRLDLQIAERKPEPRSGADAQPPSEIVKPASGGWKLDLRQADIREARASWGRETTSGALTGTALHITPEGESWIIRADGGAIAQNGWPELQLETARLRYRAPSLFLTESTLRSGGGTIAMTGEINSGQGIDLQVTLDGIGVTPLLAADWRARLHGRISGSAHVRAPLGGAAAGGLRIEGSARLAEGQLTALPVLDEIATFTRSQRFRQLGLSKASLDFTQDAERFSARNVIAESEGLLRVEGSFSVVDGQIDGTFQVGVTPASLQWLPGSQARVFTVARDGYLWTPMRLSGRAGHPTEDLTPRLAAAAASEVLKHVETTVRETTKGLLDLLTP